MRGAATSPHTALERALLAGLTPASVMIESDQETPWASATFTGKRHYFDMTVSGKGAISAAANLGMMISENRVSIEGHVIADILLSSHQLVQTANIPFVVIGVEALTVRE